MIVYADTSTLIKLFVEEENSTKTRDMPHRAQAMGTGLLTRTELIPMCAAVMGDCSDEV